MNQTRPERRQPLLSDYPIHDTITARVSDLDGYGHLNAIRTGHFYENARAAFYGPAFNGLPHMRSLVAQLNITYLREGFWPGTLVIGTGIAKIGRASFEMGQALFQNDLCLGLCQTVLVYTEGGRSAPFPQAGRTRLEGLMIKGAAATAAS